MIYWEPKYPEKSQMWQFLEFVNSHEGSDSKSFNDLHNFSITHIAKFWQYISIFFKIKFYQKTNLIVSKNENLINTKWFEKASLNYAEHLCYKSSALAIISINENGDRQTLTYSQLLEKVSACQHGLLASGIKTGDHVAAILPNIPETIIAFLACASLGVIWCSCSPDFGKNAISDRFQAVMPKLLFVSNGYTYKGKKFTPELVNCPSIKKIVEISYLKDANIAHTSWDDFLVPGKDIEFKPLKFSHPLYILFSSGTTGKPKCLVHGGGNVLLQHLKELALHCDLRAAEKLLFYTTCGWMMWNWMISALSIGVTLVLYEGCPTYPQADHLLKIIDQEEVAVFGTSAKYLSSIAKLGLTPNKKYKFTKLRSILSTGSPLLPASFDYVAANIKKLQLASMSGGTDIVSCFALGNPLSKLYRGEIQGPGLGMAVEIFDAAPEIGELVCTKPAPSMPLYLLNDHNKELYNKTYFSKFDNVWMQGDLAKLTENGGIIIYGRSDATLNPGGVRIGTAEIYRQLEKIPEVTDYVAVAQDTLDDIRIILFVILKDKVKLSQQLVAKINTTLKKNASPRHVPAKIVAVSDIPRTINGKTVEIAVKRIINGDVLDYTGSIINPQALEFFKNWANNN